MPHVPPASHDSKILYLDKIEEFRFKGLKLRNLESLITKLGITLPEGPGVLSNPRVGTVQASGSVWTVEIHLRNATETQMRRILKKIGLRPAGLLQILAVAAYSRRNAWLVNRRDQVFCFGEGIVPPQTPVPIFDDGQLIERNMLGDDGELGLIYQGTIIAIPIE